MALPISLSNPAPSAIAGAAAGLFAACAERADLREHATDIDFVHGNPGWIWKHTSGRASSMPRVAAMKTRDYEKRAASKLRHTR